MKLMTRERSPKHRFLRYAAPAPPKTSTPPRVLSEETAPPRSSRFRISSSELIRRPRHGLRFPCNPVPVFTGEPAEREDSHFQRPHSEQPCVHVYFVG